MTRDVQMSLLDDPAQASNGTEEADEGTGQMTGAASGRLVRREAITDEGLAHFQQAYPGEQISK